MITQEPATQDFYTNVQTLRRQARLILAQVLGDRTMAGALANAGLSAVVLALVIRWRGIAR